MKVYAIVPARSNSRGLVHKNIKPINGKPLLAYSIEFALKLDYVDKVICSTDSPEYAEIAIKYGAEVPFLRSDFAANDSAMEEDILADFKTKFEEHGIDEPDLMVWLRPTFVFRSKKDVEQCIEVLLNDSKYSAARTVVKAENRLYSNKDGFLSPNFDTSGRSMIRRQEMPEAYNVFSTDVFRFKGNDLGKNFLGDAVYPVITSSICGLDIDGLLDFEIVRLLIEHQHPLINDYL